MSASEDYCKVKNIKKDNDDYGNLTYCILNIP